MIKKTQMKVKNDKFGWIKDVNGLQYNKVKKANSYVYGDENGHNRLPLSYTSKH